MKLRFPALALLVTILSPFLAAQNEETQGTTLNGQVAGDQYLSPTGVFKVRIPVLPELGGDIADTPNVVTFEDAISTHISIAAFPFSREQKWEFETRGAKEYLGYFFSTFVMPDFLQRFRGAKVETALFVPALQEGSLLVYTLLPGGSIFEASTRISDGVPIVIAKRGNLCFVKYSHVFVISTELAERTIERMVYKRTVQEENDLLRNRLIAILNRIEFIKPREAAR